MQSDATKLIIDSFLSLISCLQGPLSDQDQYLGSSDPAAGMKPLLYSQHYGGQPGYGGMPPDGGFHNPSMSGHMGPQRMPPAGYPPMMRMPGSAGPRPVGMRPGGPNPGVPPQPNNLRLQLQHRLQAQLVGHMFYITILMLTDHEPNKFICKLSPKCSSSAWIYFSSVRKKSHCSNLITANRFWSKMLLL